MRDELHRALIAARELPREELPKLLGELEEIRCTAIARLTPAPAVTSRDELLDVDQAASRLGMSKDYLYRHHAQFSFARRVGRRSLRFSARGIDEYTQAAKSH
jgi:predicted DNA-binding transcriptional regulator AlpA